MKNLFHTSNGKVVFMSKNTNLHDAKRAKQDEFYTQWADIENEMDPRNTSRRCSSCGHVAQENRESQAVFLCKKCGHSDNADHNAAINILDRALRDHEEEIITFWGGKHPSVRAYKPGSCGPTTDQHSSTTRKPHVLASR